MLSAIFSAVGGQIIEQVFGQISGLFKAYFDKQITEAQLKEQLLAALLGAMKDIEIAHADALAKTYASFMDAVEKSKLMQAVWASVVISQLLVLLWHQVGIPALVAYERSSAHAWSYPSSGTTVEWAYLLLGACLGMGPVVLRSGPSAGNIAGTLKAIIGK